MSLGKRISRAWNSFVCLIVGHTQSYVCTRCGKVVNLQGTKRKTLEERINGYFAQRKANKGKTEKYDGSLKIKPGLHKYAINLKTNELSIVAYDTEYDFEGNVKSRKAKFDPCCVYIDAMNDDVAIRKANNYLFGIKRGVVIKEVTKTETKQTSLTVNV